MLEWHGVINFWELSFILKVRNNHKQIIFQMTVSAHDYPGEGALPRSSEATVIVNVRRNPNTPLFIQSSYNITISEYTAVQAVIATIRATDADPDDVSWL